MSYTWKEARELLHAIDRELELLPERTEVISLDLSGRWGWMENVRDDEAERFKDVQASIHVYGEITRPDRNGNRKELYIADFDDRTDVIFYISSGVLVFRLRDKPKQKPKVRKYQTVKPYKRHKKEASENERESDSGSPSAGPTFESGREQESVL